jgi:hypothetical protein
MTDNSDPFHAANVAYDAGQNDGYIAGYAAAMEDGWGEPGHIKAAIEQAVQRVIALPDLSDAGFTYMNLLNRAVVIDAIRGEP